MSIVRKLSLTAKLALVPTLVMVCLTVSSISAFVTNQRTAAAIDRVATHGLPNIVKAGALKEHLASAYALLMQSVAYEGAELKPATIAAVDQQVPLAFKALHAEATALEQAAEGRPEVQAQYAQLQVKLTALERFAVQVVDMKGVGLAAAAISITGAEGAYRALQTQMTELIAIERRAGEAQAALAADAVRVGDRASLALCATALLLALAVTFVCVRLITQPLQQAVAIAQAVADGDLSHRVDGPVGADASGQVLRALGEVTVRLSGMLAGIRESADRIDTATREIAMGNDDLSQRTERAASSLQATAATMLALSTTVQHNADTAQEAHRLTGQALDVAREGGEAVAGVVRTMDEIDAQAKKINAITGVIDGIAFQTNILALNAAVEAARAGEQGRGFAVVAQEVRGLAGRSAVAAKEIRTLIGTSVKQIEDGTVMMRSAGHTVQRVVGSIDRVSVLAAGIAAASTEQASGFGSVNRAIGEMDRNTQQNAALVEQAAAATESLRTQTADLLKAVSMFTTT